MFATTTAFSSIAVDDLDSARDFYGGTLGLEVTENEMGILTIGLEGGSRPTIAYPKPDFVPATYTVLNFDVPDIDATVEELSRRGVTLLRYDDFEQDDLGIARGEGPPIAWFTDPAGNIIAVMQTS